MGIGKSELFLQYFNTYGDGGLVLDHDSSGVNEYKFICRGCGRISSRRACLFRENPILNCGSCLKRGNTQVSDGEILDKLAETGAIFISRQMIAAADGFYQTEITFLCPGLKRGCKGVTTRTWQGLNDPRKKKGAVCQICAQSGLRGKDHPQYNPDLPDRVRKDRRWMAADIEWQDKVFERDGWICRITGQKGGKLQAHHLNSRTHWPSLKFDISNGITICKELHDEYHRIPGCKRLATAETFQEFYYGKTRNTLIVSDYILKHGPSEILGG